MPRALLAELDLQSIGEEGDQVNNGSRYTAPAKGLHVRAHHEFGEPRTLTAFWLLSFTPYFARALFRRLFPKPRTKEIGKTKSQAILQYDSDHS